MARRDVPWVSPTLERPVMSSVYALSVTKLGTMVLLAGVGDDSKMLATPYFSSGAHSRLGALIRARFESSKIAQKKYTASLRSALCKSETSRGPKRLCLLSGSLP